MNKRKGFTLVELLVVIAIIALLMGILMPALARVRRSAQASACMVQVKQWATVFSMYTGDWEGGFHSDYIKLPGSSTWHKTIFAEKLQGYYQDLDLLYCPSAKKTRPEGKVPNSAWSFSIDYDTANTKKNPTGRTYYGSYTVNMWFGDMEKDQQVQYDRTLAKRWRNLSLMRQPTTVPIFGDVCDYPRVFPNAYTTPPADIDTTSSDTSGDVDAATDKLMNFCIRRHGPLTDPTVNIAFGDFSVRATNLKALWSLNWHRDWVNERKTKQPQVQWPEWMRGYSDKDYIEY